MHLCIAANRKMETNNICHWFTCFVPPPAAPSNEIFGFGEFVSAIALLVVVFHIVDFRYRFRLQILPRYFLRIVLGLIVFIGLGELTMELWLQEGWWTLRSPISPSMWEAIFAGLFLGTFVLLTYRLFVDPPVFGNRNAHRYAQALYRVILKGDDTELAIAAGELGRSTRELVLLSASKSDRAKTTESVEVVAHDILLMIANRKFCRHIVASAQSTAIYLFEDASEVDRYDLPLGPFCQAVTEEAIRNKDSILYHETERFASDVIGNIKPWSKSLYGNYMLISSMGFHSPLSISAWSMDRKWDIEQWSAYTKVLLAILDGYAKTKYRGDSRDLANACEHLHWLTIGLGRVDANEFFFESEDYKKLELAVDFIKEAAKTLDDASPPIRAPLKVKEKYSWDIYEGLAKLMRETLLSATNVQGSFTVTWSVQHNATWGQIFSRIGKPSRSLKVIRKRLVRLLYIDIKEMDEFGPNYQGVRVVGLVLNVVGLEASSRKHSLSCVRSIHWFARRWAQQNYLKLHQEYPDVAKTLLVSSLEFDSKNRRLVKTYASWLGKEGSKKYLSLDEPGI